jgi:hypothetical protein
LLHDRAVGVSGWGQQIGRSPVCRYRMLCRAASVKCQSSASDPPAAEPAEELVKIRCCPAANPGDRRSGSAERRSTHRGMSWTTRDGVNSASKAQQSIWVECSLITVKRERTHWVATNSPPPMGQLGWCPWRHRINGRRPSAHTPNEIRYWSLNRTSRAMYPSRARDFLGYGTRWTDWNGRWTLRFFPWKWTARGVSRMWGDQAATGDCRTVLDVGSNR